MGRKMGAASEVDSIGCYGGKIKGKDRQGLLSKSNFTKSEKIRLMRPV